MTEIEMTRFERARIIGARALQIALGAPILLPEEDVPAERTIDPVPIAHEEIETGVLPITVHRPREPEPPENRAFY